MLHRLEFRAMGCQMMAALDSPSTGGHVRLVRIPEWFEGWEQALSRFRPDSELSRINQQAGSPVQVSTDLWRVFVAARQAEASSMGLVTPLVLDALQAAGYVSSFEPGMVAAGSQHLADTDWTLGTPVPIRARQIESNAAGRMIHLPVNAHLDFGGVAKGWAANQAVKRLQVYGPALVDAGGDISVSGLQLDGSPWPVGIADPLHPGENLEILMVGRCGIATSGRDYRRWQRNGRWEHHIIDPRSGMPAETDVLCATVVAPDVLEAEMAAKTVLILGSRAGLAWLEERHGLAALLVLDSGERLYNKQMQRYLWRETDGKVI